LVRNELLFKTLRLGRGEDLPTKDADLLHAKNELQKAIFKDCPCLKHNQEDSTSCKHNQPEVHRVPHAKKVFQQLRSRIGIIAKREIAKHEKEREEEHEEEPEDDQGWVDVTAEMKLGRHGRTLGQCGIQTGTKWIQKRQILKRVALEQWQQKWREMMGSDDNHDDVLRIGAGDPGGTTFLTVYDIYNGCVYRFGHGLASHADRTTLKQRRQLQSLLDRLRNNEGNPDQDQVRVTRLVS